MKKILIVDDNQQNLYLLQVLLTARGYQVEQAVNGAEALECARREPPYMIVSDILMPVMDGYALCRECRDDKRLKNIPFIFYTATYTEPADQEFALKLGADKFIIKPVEPDIFAKILLETEKEFEEGKLVSAKPQIENEVYYKEYNAALIRKLEDKMRELEAANRILLSDITERKRTDEELRIALVKYKTLFECLPLGVTVTDNTGIILETNLTAEKLLGIQNSEHIKRTIDSPEWNIERSDGTTMPSDEYAGVKALKLRHTVENVEMGVVKPDNTITWLNVTAAPLPLDNYGVVITYSDITGQKHDENKQKKLEDQLRQSQKMEAIGQLSSGVAHDFNNLLGGIVGNAELLKMDLHPQSPLQGHLDCIISSCLKAGELTKQLLSFARKAPVELQEIEVNVFLKQVANLMRRTIDRSIEIVLDLPEDISFICGDPNNLENALLNIAINARDAMPDGGRFSIELENVHLNRDSLLDSHYEVKNGEYARISLTDTGTGMSREVKNHIFEPFFTTKEVGKGTGLGLAAVFGCVKQHDGYITMASEEGAGTKFELYLPIVKHTDNRAVEDGKAAIPRGYGNLLVVDDEPIYHEIISKIFGNLGFAVHCCSDGVEAIEYYREHTTSIQVVILDLNMPKMSGRQCYINLKKINPDIQIIIASGFGDIKEQEALQKEGAGVFIHKPYNAKELRAKITELTGI